MAISKTKKAIPKKLREDETGLIDDAAAQMAPAPQPVDMPATPEAPIAADPSQVGFFPPQAGMIPSGWMSPTDSAQAAVMDSGDVNMATAAPGGGVVGGAPISNEEAQLVTEYRKWSKAKRLEATKARLAKRVERIGNVPTVDGDEEEAADARMDAKAKDSIKKNADADSKEDAEHKARMARQAASKKRPVEKALSEKEARIAVLKAKIAEKRKAAKLLEDQEELEDEVAMSDAFPGGEDVDISDEMGEMPAEDTGNEELDVQDELKDIAIDINSLFADLGGDVDEVMPGEEEEDFDDEEEMPSDEDEEVSEDEEEMLEERKQRIRTKIAEMRKKNARKNRQKESELAKAIDIKMPAGVGQSDLAEEEGDTVATKMQAYEKKVAARRKLLAELRRSAAMRETDACDIDPDKLDAEEGYDSITSVADEVTRDRNSKKVRSAVIKEASTRSNRFVEKYEEKKELNFKELLSKGLLG